MSKKSISYKILVFWGTVALAFGLIGTPPAIGQSETPEKKDPYSRPLDILNRSDFHFIPGLGIILNEIRDFSRKKNPKKIAEAISRIAVIKKKMDTGNLFPVSDYLIVEADRMAFLQDFGTARALLRGAGELSPDYGMVDFKRAAILFKQDPLNAPQALSACYSAFKKTIKRRAQWDRISAGFFKKAFFVASLAFFFLFLFLFLFYLPTLFYDMRSFTPFTFARAPSVIFAVALLLLPAAIGGGKLFLLAVPVFLWGYLSSQARGLTLIFFFYLTLILPFLMEEMAQKTVYGNSTVYRALERTSWGDWDHETLYFLKAELNKKEPSPQVFFALGYIYKKKREYAKALEYYSKYLEIVPADPLALSNIGALYMEQKNYRTAVKFLNRAVKADPNLVEAHLNLNRSYLESKPIDTRKAKMEMDKAVLLNPAFTKQFTAEDARGGGSENLDCLLPRPRVSEYLTGLNRKVDLWFNAAWRACLGPMAVNVYFFFLAGAAIILSGFYYFKQRSGYSQTCSSCGEVFIDPLKLSAYVRKRCYPCTAVSSRKRIFDPKKKKERQAKIIKYQINKKRRGWLMSVIFPGAGFIYRGRDYLGFVFLVMNSLLIVVAASSYIQGTRVGVTDPVSFVSSNFPLLGVALGYYLLSVLLYSLPRKH